VHPRRTAPLALQRLLVIVGVTGVGKSTTLEQLAETGAPFTLLPDRRALTDSLIIAAMQAADGLAPAPVADRRERFAYTRRFRERYPGGMADALRLLSVEPQASAQLLIFDGLRGENEVIAACAGLPEARFVLLDAPDAVRVVRLLGRNDPFDQISSTAPSQRSETLAEVGLAGEEAQAIFSPLEQRLLIGLVEQGAVAADQLRACIEIVLEERRNYDPAATRRALEAHAGPRALVIDTTAERPEAAAHLIAERLATWWPDSP
jgi:hypothetical protein